MLASITSRAGLVSEYIKDFFSPLARFISSTAFDNYAGFIQIFQRGFLFWKMLLERISKGGAPLPPPGHQDVAGVIGEDAVFAAARNVLAGWGGCRHPDMEALPLL